MWLQIWSHVTQTNICIKKLYFTKVYFTVMCVQLGSELLKSKKASSKSILKWVS